MYKNWRDLIKPKQLQVEKESLSDTYGKFFAEPFERGFGTTLGNSLRRILLSSLQGAAITVMKPINRPPTRSTPRLGAEYQRGSLALTCSRNHVWPRRESGTRSNTSSYISSNAITFARSLARERSDVCSTLSRSTTKSVADGYGSVLETNTIP